ncbi:alpha/beta fold hydrolase [Ottowia sp. VDI28]|uniref:alpha/beta fold hydrolase n=1 Tax=Ottowia sp. VDI28 TaxID=3133968 RepID=UPI003C2E0F14
MLVRRAFADLSVGQVHFAECGSANAPAVLLLHQSPRSWAEYRAVLPLLGRRFRGVAMDTVGFGDSPPPPWEPSIERWAGVAAELLEALGIERAHVVGHHTGGVIAVELAVNFSRKVGAVVLSSTPYTNEAFRIARAHRPPIDAVEPSPDGAHLMQMWRNRQAFYPEGRPELLQSFVLDGLKASGDIEGGHRAVANYRMEDRIGRVTQPVLLIRARQDPFSSPHAAELAEHLKDARIVDIEGGMVPLPDQLPEAFAQAVTDFLVTQS